MSKLNPLRTLSFRIDDRLIILAPTPASRVFALELLLQESYRNWRSLNRDTESWAIANRGILQQIANLLPRLDDRLAWGFEIEAISLDKLTSLFLFQIENNEYSLSEIAALHQRTTEAEAIALEPVEGEDIGDWMPPIPSSGDSNIDLQAALVTAFGFSGGMEAFCTLDRDAIDRLLQQCRQHQKDPEVVRQEFLAKKLQSVQAENPEFFNSLLGL